MKREAQFLPPRQQVIFHHTRRMLDTSKLCQRKFAMLVAEQYIALTAPDVRHVPFRWGVTGEDLFKAEKHNGQVLGRYMDGTVKVLPADLEDAWLLAMPDPFRAECERDLARRRGAMSIRLDTMSSRNVAAGVVIGAERLFSEMSQLVAALGPALADNRFTEADRKYLGRIQNEGDDVISVILQLQRLAESQCGAKP